MADDEYEHDRDEYEDGLLPPLLEVLGVPLGAGGGGGAVEAGGGGVDVDGGGGGGRVRGRGRVGGVGAGGGERGRGAGGRLFKGKEALRDRNMEVMFCNYRLRRPWPAAPSSSSSSEPLQTNVAPECG